jgi:hypothetical protein
MSTKNNLAMFQLLELLESRYAIRVLWALSDGHPQTFRLLQDSVGGIKRGWLSMMARATDSPRKAPASPSACKKCSALRASGPSSRRAAHRPPPPEALGPPQRPEEPHLRRARRSGTPAHGRGGDDQGWVACALESGVAPAQAPARWRLTHTGCHPAPAAKVSALHRGAGDKQLAPPVEGTALNRRRSRKPCPVRR